VLTAIHAIGVGFPHRPLARAWLPYFLMLHFPDNFPTMKFPFKAILYICRMRLLVELPEQENNRNEFFEFLRIRGGKWTPIPDTEKLAIPGGKPLSYEQLDALMEASMVSESRSIDAFTKEIKKKLSGGEP
jgi:hypothetical protein